MPVMTEEQFSHLEAMMRAVVDASIKAYHANPSSGIHGSREEALAATDIEHEVRRKAKEALTK